MQSYIGNGGGRKLLRWNVRNQILAVGVTSLAVLFVAVAYFYGFAKSELESNSKNLIGTTNDQLVEDINRVFIERAGAFQSWVRDDVFGLAIEFQTTQEMNKQFHDWLNDDAGFTLLTLVDKQGTVLEAAGGSEIGQRATQLKGRNLVEISEVKNQNSDGMYFIEVPTLKKMSGDIDKTIMFYHPSISTSGSRNGAFVAFVDFEGVNSLVSGNVVRLKEYGYVDASCMLLFPQKQVVGSSSFAAGVKDSEALTVGAFNWLKSTGQSGVHDAEFADESFAAGIGSVNMPKIGSDSGRDQSDPFVLSMVPKGNITSQLNSVLFMIGVITLLGTVLMVTVSYMIARRIAGNIEKLTRISKRLAEGAIDCEINVRTNDEIGELSNGFRDLTNYLKDMAETAEKVSGNDLTVEVKPKSDDDVLGKSFASMVRNLSRMITQIADNAQVLSSAANEISATSEQMAKGSRDQAERVGDVSTAVEEMAASIVESSKNAESASDASRNSSDTATKGGDIVGQTIQGMQEINRVVRESAESMTELARAADDIGRIISVIDDIADQTNLLALNAAIEAARAGEQGRGFAVVADEVRKLAERTGTATGEIASMIRGIQDKSEHAVHSMELGVQEIDKGRGLADTAGESLKEVVSTAESVMSMIQQIASATQEQSAGAEVVSRNIEQISSVAKETASGAEQSASVAEELNKQTQMLQDIVESFKLDVKETTDREEKAPAEKTI